MAIATEQTGIGLSRHFTTPGADPYDTVTWERRDARITNWATGAVAFEQLGVEVPSGWSVNATNILAQKYFRGTLGTPEREWSLKQVADRVVGAIVGWGQKDGYFTDKAEAEAFEAELKWLIIHQRAAFNSPVWFNIGVAGVPQQAAACFILAVDDSMDSILNWYVEEGRIFKGGSGAGVNLSRIRSSKEGLRGGGTASGPVSFMRGADSSAGTIKSGGKTRRAAKMVVLDAGHPDIEDFIWCKAIEERKARALRDSGFRHGPRRPGQLFDPVPKRQQFGAGHRRVYAGRGGRQGLGAPGGHDWRGPENYEGQGALRPNCQSRLGMRRPRDAVRYHHK